MERYDLEEFGVKPTFDFKKYVDPIRESILKKGILVDSIRSKGDGIYENDKE